MKRPSATNGKAQLCGNAWGQPRHNLWITLPTPTDVDNYPTYPRPVPHRSPAFPRLSHTLPLLESLSR